MAMLNYQRVYSADTIEPDIHWNRMAIVAWRLALPGEKSPIFFGEKTAGDGVFFFLETLDFNHSM